MQPTPEQIAFYERHGGMAAKTAAIVENAVPSSAMSSFAMLDFLALQFTQLGIDTTDITGETNAVCRTLELIAGTAIAAHERFHRDIKRLFDDIEAANMQDTEASKQRDTSGRPLDT